MARKLETKPESLIVTSSFWKQWRNKIATEVIPYQWEVINDEREIDTPIDPGNGDTAQDLEAKYSHAIRNLRIAAGRLKGNFKGFVFQDSDVYKWLEEAAYSLSYTKDPKLKKLCDEVIDLISDAQLEDGYLDTPFIIKSGIYETRKRFAQIHQSHEMYVMGHYIEAGVAYYQVTGNSKALDIAKKMADCLIKNFGIGEGQIPGADGHPEIELALAKLYEATKEEKYLELGKFFLTIRGQDPYFYDKQNAKIGNGSTDIFPIMRTWSHEYSLAARPVIELTQVVGHSVRALYLVTGCAHIGRLTNDKDLIKTSERLWNNIVHKRMYVTGAVGSTSNGEAFTYDYDLPNDIMYGESCASVALSVLASKMLEIKLKGEYADVLEKELFNSGISGIALDGKHFFYVNPLEADNEASFKIPARKHVLTSRAEWFTCACCPSNIARFIAGVHRFIYTIDKPNRIIGAHQFIANKATFFDDIKVEQKSNFPWEGRIIFGIRLPHGKKDISFAVRIPSWSKDKYEIKLDNRKLDIKPIDGFIYVPIKPGTHVITLDLDMSIKLIRSNTNIRFDAGKVCVMRGPVVYAAESIENKDPLWNYKISIKDIKKAKSHFNKKLLGGVITISIPSTYRVKEKDNVDLYLDTSKKIKKIKTSLKLIPYYAWANRSAKSMLVWFDSDL